MALFCSLRKERNLKFSNPKTSTNFENSIIVANFPLPSLHNKIVEVQRSIVDRPPIKLFYIYIDKYTICAFRSTQRQRILSEYMTSDFENEKTIRYLEKAQLWANLPDYIQPTHTRPRPPVELAPLSKTSNNFHQPFINLGYKASSCRTV